MGRCFASDSLHRLGLTFDVAKLALANHVHDLDVGDDNPSTAKGLHSEHGSRNAFDCAMILLDDIVQVLRLAHRDDKAAVGLHADDSGRVGAALVDGDFLWHVVQTDRPFEECRVAA